MNSSPIQEHSGSITQGGKQMQRILTAIFAAMIMVSFSGVTFVDAKTKAEEEKEKKEKEEKEKDKCPHESKTGKPPKACKNKDLKDN
jgi:hypothetical protein